MSRALKDSSQKIESSAVALFKKWDREFRHGSPRERPPECELDYESFAKGQVEFMKEYLSFFLLLNGRTAKTLQRKARWSS
jgi:hypothetical protein